VTLSVIVGSPVNIDSVLMGVVLTAINEKKVEDASMFSKTLQSPNKVFSTNCIEKEETGTIKLKNSMLNGFVNDCKNQFKYK
jgi:hypothetical protein